MPSMISSAYTRRRIFGFSYLDPFDLSRDSRKYQRAFLKTGTTSLLYGRLSSPFTSGASVPHKGQSQRFKITCRDLFRSICLRRPQYHPPSYHPCDLRSSLYTYSGLSSLRFASNLFAAGCISHALHSSRMYRFLVRLLFLVPCSQLHVPGLGTWNLGNFFFFYFFRLGVLVLFNA